MTKQTLPPLVDRLKALAHPVRLRILAMLRGGELCVCEITDVVGLAPSTISQHLSDLRRTGFVSERKLGKWVHYSLVADPANASLLEALWTDLSGDSAIKADHQIAKKTRGTACAIFCPPKRSKP